MLSCIEIPLVIAFTEIILFAGTNFLSLFCVPQNCETTEAFCTWVPGSHCIEYINGANNTTAATDPQLLFLWFTILCQTNTRYRMSRTMSHPFLLHIKSRLLQAKQNISLPPWCIHFGRNSIAWDQKCKRYCINWQWEIHCYWAKKWLPYPSIWDWMCWTHRDCILCWKQYSNQTYSNTELLYGFSIHFHNERKGSTHSHWK